MPERGERVCLAATRVGPLLQPRPPMPVACRVDPTNRLRIVAGEGTVTGDELLGAYSRILADPAFDPSLRELVDVRRVERADVPTSALRALADRLRNVRWPQGRTVAVLTRRDQIFIYGLARMYGALRRFEEEEYHVFKDCEEACRWLGIDPESVCGWRADRGEQGE